jgi:hypothetical protein
MKIKSFKVAQLLMMKRILDYAFAPANIGTTNSIVALSAAFNLLKGKVTTIDEMLELYEQILKGIAAEKKQARLTLAENSYAILKGAKAWAIATGKLDLAAQWTVSLSALKRMKFETLSLKESNWISTVTPHAADLADYNVTPAMMTAWNTANDDFNTLLNAPQLASKNHKNLGKNIFTAINTAMELTKGQIDGIVATLMLQQPGYYSGYRTQREILEPKHRHTTLLATVVNELGQPFYGVTVTVDEYIHISDNGKTTVHPAHSATTDINGKALANKFFAAARSITVSGPGITTKTFGPIQFERGKALTQTFVVSPSFENLPESTEAPAPAPQPETVK